MTTEERIEIMRTIGRILKDDDTQAANAANEEMGTDCVAVPALRTLCFACGLDAALTMDTEILVSLAFHWESVA